MQYSSKINSLERMAENFEKKRGQQSIIVVQLEKKRRREEKESIKRI